MAKGDFGMLFEEVFRECLPLGDICMVTLCLSRNHANLYRVMDQF
jgi:hypothetical protein